MTQSNNADSLPGQLAEDMVVTLNGTGQSPTGPFAASPSWHLPGVKHPTVGSPTTTSSPHNLNSATLHSRSVETESKVHLQTLGSLVEEFAKHHEIALQMAMSSLRPCQKCQAIEAIVLDDKLWTPEANKQLAIKNSPALATGMSSHVAGRDVKVRQGVSGFAMGMQARENNGHEQSHNSAPRTTPLEVKIEVDYTVPPASNAASSEYGEPFFAVAPKPPKTVSVAPCEDDKIATKDRSFQETAKAVMKATKSVNMIRTKKELKSGGTVSFGALNSATKRTSKCSMPAGITDCVELVPLKELEKELKAARAMSRDVLRAHRGDRKCGRMGHDVPESEDGGCWFIEYIDAAFRFLLRDRRLDMLCGIVVLINSIVVGLVTNYLVGHEEETSEMAAISFACDIFFFLELMLRLRVFGRNFFTNEDKYWNVFDTLLVALSIVDVCFVFVIDGDAPGEQRRMMKNLKMLRILRLCRAFKILTEIGMLVLMIVDSLRPFFWALTMMFIIVYMCAIYFTSAVTQHVDTHLNGERTGSYEQLYGNMAQTMLTLVCALLGGVNWYGCLTPLISIGWLPTAIFLSYVTFTTLVVLNVVTGVFVENAVVAANEERAILQEKERELRERYLSELSDIFELMDSDKDGYITADELAAYFSDYRVQLYFHNLGLDVHDTERLFSLLDCDGSESIEIQEFLDGCLRLKGEARSLDLFAIQISISELAPNVFALLDHFGIEHKGRSKKFISPISK